MNKKRKALIHVIHMQARTDPPGYREYPGENP